MQSRGARIGVVVIAIAVVVVLFLVLRDDGGDEEPATTTPAAEQPTTPDAGDAAGGGGEKPKPKPEPEVATSEIEVEGGQPVGGVQEIEIPSGEKAEIVVSSPDTTEHVHLHGYDVIADLAPGKPARLTFDAKIDGVFEMELEDSVVPIAEVTVSNRG